MLGVWGFELPVAVGSITMNSARFAGWHPATFSESPPVITMIGLDVALAMTATVGAVRCWMRVVADGKGSLSPTTVHTSMALSTFLLASLPPTNTA